MNLAVTETKKVYELENHTLMFDVTLNQAEEVIQAMYHDAIYQFTDETWDGYSIKLTQGRHMLNWDDETVSMWFLASIDTECPCVQESFMDSLERVVQGFENRECMCVVREARGAECEFEDGFVIVVGVSCTIHD